MIGDILHDVEAGNRAGCKSILIDNGNETEWIANEFRQPYGMEKNINEAAQLILSQTGRTTRQLSGLSGIRKSL
jgi:phosphoglycolate phosphatase-like HAD superfamily hydrolase